MHKVSLYIARVRISGEHSLISSNVGRKTFFFLGLASLDCVCWCVPSFLKVNGLVTMLFVCGLQPLSHFEQHLAYVYIRFYPLIIY